MSAGTPAKKNAICTFYIGLVSQANVNILQANPTIAAGDFKVSTDGGALGNPATLPAVTPASSKAVLVTLSAAEMNGDDIVLIASDASGAEWCDLLVHIKPSTRNIDDLAFPTTSGRSLDVSAAGEAGVDWANIGSPTTAVALTGTTVDLVTGAVDAAALAADAVDEIWDEVMAEQAQGIPSATPSFRVLLSYLWMAFRNQIQVTNSEKRFTDDAGTVVFKKALTDDGTTYAEAEAASGP